MKKDIFKLKEPVSFGMTSEEAAHFSPDELNEKIISTVDLWKRFISKQSIITTSDDPDEFSKYGPKSVSDEILLQVKFPDRSLKGNPIADATFRKNGRVVLMFHYDATECSYGIAWDRIFWNVTGQSFLPVLGLAVPKSKNEFEKVKDEYTKKLNAWITESEGKNPEDNPEFFIQHYAKEQVSI